MTNSEIGIQFTCKECKYWGIETDFTCSRIVLSEEYEAVRDAKQKDSVLASLDADALDDSGIKSRLICGPKFGCRLFEKK